MAGVPPTPLLFVRCVGCSRVLSSNPRGTSGWPNFLLDFVAASTDRLLAATSRHSRRKEQIWQESRRSRLTLRSHWTQPICYSRVSLRKVLERYRP